MLLSNDSSIIEMEKITRNNKYNKSVGTFQQILLILFSIVTALGSFNPLGIGSIEESANSSSPVALLIQGLFVISLLFLKKIRPSVSNETKVLVLFASFWVFTSFIQGINDVTIQFGVNCLKLCLCIVLFCKLPEFFYVKPRLLIISVLIFSLTCAGIAALFSLGLLDPFVLWSNGRASIFYENPNSTSTRMMFSTLFILYIMFQNPLKWGFSRYYLLILILPLLYTIMASGSRGSLIVVVFSIILYLLFMPSKKFSRKLGIIAITVLIVSGSILKLSENEDFSIIKRLTATVENEEDGGRTMLSAAALNIFLDNPVDGVGGIEFPLIMKKEYGFNLTVHNLYWYIAATSGLIGLLLFGVFVFMLLKLTWGKRGADPIGFVLLVAMLLIASKTGGILTYMIMWYVFSLSISFATIKYK